MFLFTKEDWKIKWDFASLKDWKYKVTELDERTLQQNAFLFGWIYKNAVEAFARKWNILNVEHAHFFFKSQFLKKRKKCKVTGKYRMETGSTIELSKKAFSKYIENIRQWVLDNLEYDIPEPTNQEELLYYESFI